MSRALYYAAMNGYFDSHCHLYFDRFDEDREQVIERAREAGFTHIMNVGIDVETSHKTLALAQEYPGFCYASAGLHPTETSMSADELSAVVSELEALIRANPDPIRAVGEIGLDYYWDRSTPTEQDVAFRAQLELAKRVDLPVIIHCRDALSDCIAVVAEYADRVQGVFHCFGGTAEDAKQVLELGWYVSFAGNVTYPKAEELRAAARVCPPERLLLETDAPFLAPQAKRGKRNEPAYCLHTGDFLAEFFGIESERFREQTAANARQLFRIP